MIEIQNINHSYDNDNFIIKNFSLNIKKGESIGLTGPSECGKNSLAHIISGYITPSSGSILINGKDYTEQPSRNIFKTIQELKAKIKVWNEEYNNLEHCGLNGKTPNEMLKLTNH